MTMLRHKPYQSLAGAALCSLPAAGRCRPSFARKAALEDGHRHAEKDRIGEEAERPDADADQRLIDDGRYSTIWPSGVGIKPGITRPMPFSIQMPVMHSTQVKFSHFRLRLSGSTSRNMARD